MAADRAVKVEFGADALRRSVDRDAQRLHGVHDDDADRSNLGCVAPIDRSPLGCEHADLLAVADETERGIHDVTVRVQAHGERKVASALVVDSR